MDPINYILDVKNPLDEYMKGLKFARTDLADQQAMQINQQNMSMAQQQFEDQQRALQEQRNAASKQQAEALQLQNDLSQAAALAESGGLTSDYLKNMELKHAKTFEDFGAAFSGKTEEQKAAQTSRSVNLAVALLGDMPEFGVKMLEEQIAAVGPDSNEAKPLLALLNVAKTNPKAAGTSVLFTGTATGIIPQASADMILKQTQPNQGEAGVQSSLVGKLATVIVRTNGTVEVRDNRTNQIVTGADAEKLIQDDKQLAADVKRAVEQGGAEGRLQAAVDLGAVAAAAEAGGKAAVDLSIESFKQISNIRSNMLNLDRAIQLVEEEGANTGVIASKLPTWNQATLELENLQKTLGLDVIGAVTFGALSQSELDLAQTVALPTNLNEKELADWLRRKKTAQEKLANYLSQQSRFFSRGYPPGRWFDFLDSGEKDMTAWMRANPPGKATSAATETPAAETSASETEDSAFIQSMMAKSAKGETLTQAEMNRVKLIAAKDK